jgi:hypothetical protein
VQHCMAIGTDWNQIFLRIYDMLAFYVCQSGAMVDMNEISSDLPITLEKQHPASGASVTVCVNTCLASLLAAL